MYTTRGVRYRVMVDQRQLERAILALDARQTADERLSQSTIHDNDRGWNAADARVCGYYAAYIRRSHRELGQRLSGRFIAKARRRIHKYCGQLARMANANEQLRQAFSGVRLVA